MEEWKIQTDRLLGLNEGKQLGSLQEKITTARKMLARRMPVNVIAELTKLTELPENEIRKLMN